VKNWGESVSELMIWGGGGGDNYKKLYSALLLGYFYILYMLYSNLSRVYCCQLICLVCNCCWLVMCIVVVVLCVLSSSICMCCAMGALPFFTLDAGLLARSQYLEGHATGHLDTGFSWFPCVCKQMLRWFPTFQIATTCFSCSPPD